MPTTRLPRLVAVLGAAALWTLGTGWAQAGATFNHDVRIDDLTDTITATVNGVPVSPLGDSSGEFIHFTLPYSGGPYLFIAFSVSRDLLEPTTGLVSDRLLATFTDHVDIQFSSDPATLPPQGSTVFSPLEENGTFQFLFDVFFLPVDQFDATGDTPLAGSGSDSFSFFVRSDVDAAVPAPATLLLLGAGLTGLAGVTWRRHRRA